jgi:hypothetical protein
MKITTKPKCWICETSEDEHKRKKSASRKVLLCFECSKQVEDMQDALEILKLQMRIPNANHHSS